MSNPLSQIGSTSNLNTYHPTGTPADHDLALHDSLLALKSSQHSLLLNDAIARSRIFKSQKSIDDLKLEQDKAHKALVKLQRQ